MSIRPPAFVALYPDLVGSRKRAPSRQEYQLDNMVQQDMSSSSSWNGRPLNQGEKNCPTPVIELGPCAWWKSCASEQKKVDQAVRCRPADRKSRDVSINGLQQTTADASEPASATSANPRYGAQRLHPPAAPILFRTFHDDGSHSEYNCRPSNPARRAYRASDRLLVFLLG